MSESVQAYSHSGQTLREEVANAITHGIGTGLAVAGLVVLLLMALRSGDAWHVVGVSIYGGSLVFLYLASTLYHSFRHPPVKHVFHILDHIGIAVLIAGTYTPILLVKLRDPRGWIFFVLIWMLAVAASVFKGFFINRFTRITAGIYVAMGWMAAPLLQAMVATLGAGGFLWLAAGGLSYTLGIVPFLWSRLPFNHTIWHLFVMVGSACHFVVVARYVLPGG